jgi:hypothetical protein
MKRAYDAWLRSLAEARWRAEVREVREGLKVGMRVTHVDDNGGKFQGLVMNVRHYADGSIDGFFHADNHAKSGWKGADTFLPAEVTE